MKCPSCGAEIENSKFCTYCGTQISAEMLREKEILNKAGCPKCGSTNVSFKRENQGEVRGKNEKKIIHQTVGVCKDCGYTWTTDEGQPVKKRKTWLWVLGWIFIFPLPLTLILLKKKDMKPALKYGIIAIAWILYLIIGIFGKPATPEESVGSDTASVTYEDSTEQTTGAVTANTIEFDLSTDEIGEYGKETTLNEGTDSSYTCILFYVPAGVYTVTNNDDHATQVTVLSGIEFDGQWDQFVSDDCANPIVLMNNGDSQKLEIKEGQFVKLADDSHNIHFVLDDEK